MNKILWIMTKNKDYCEVLQSRFAIDLLSKQEIIAYGTTDPSNYDEFFVNENSFWMLVDENFDFLKTLKTLSSEGMVDLIARINGFYYCFDSTGKRYDDGTWKDSEAKQFIESNWDFTLIVAPDYDSYEANLDQLFVDDNALDSKFDDMEFIKNITKPEGKDASDFFVEEKQQTNEEQPSVCDSYDVMSNKCENEFCYCEENNFENFDIEAFRKEMENFQPELASCGSNSCGSESCPCKYESNEINLSHVDLCDKCFSTNCSCEQPICENCNVNPCICKNLKFESGECSPEDCSSCTGCQWDFTEEDDKELSHHFDCVCEDKTNDEDFFNDFVVETVSNKGESFDFQTFEKVEPFNVNEDNTEIFTANTDQLDISEFNAENKLDIANVSTEINDNDVNLDLEAIDLAHDITKTPIVTTENFIPLEFSTELANDVSNDNYFKEFDNGFFEPLQMPWKQTQQAATFELDDVDNSDVNLIDADQFYQMVENSYEQESSNNLLIQDDGFVNKVEDRDFIIKSDDVVERFTHESESPYQVDLPIVTIDYVGNQYESSEGEWPKNEISDLDNSDYVNFDEYLQTQPENDVNYEIIDDSGNNITYQYDETLTDNTVTFDYDETLVDEVARYEYDESLNEVHYDTNMIAGNNQYEIADDLQQMNYENEVYVEEPINQPIENEYKINIDTSWGRLVEEKNISKNLKKYLIELQKEKERLKRKKEEIQKRNKKARQLICERQNEL